MSKKHFEDIAEALKVSGASDHVVQQVAAALARHNPRFDWQRFVRAATQ